MKWQNESGHTGDSDTTLLKNTVRGKGPPKSKMLQQATNIASGDLFIVWLSTKHF